MEILCCLLDFLLIVVVVGLSVGLFAVVSERGTIVCLALGLYVFYVPITFCYHPLPFFYCPIPICPFVLCVSFVSFVCLCVCVCVKKAVCLGLCTPSLSLSHTLLFSPSLSISNPPFPLSVSRYYISVYHRDVIQPIECQGGYVERVTSFDSAANDVWSLGVILINLVFGRNPWKQACPRDETFSAFVLNNDFLQTILPMSDELNDIIKSVFCLNPRKRLSLPEFARRVQECTSFTTAGECVSSSSPRAAAAAAAAAGATGAETTPIRFHFGHDALLCNSRDNKAQSQGQDSGVCVELHSVA